MAIKNHPVQGSIVTVDFSEGFRPPEMVKLRLAVVLSPNMRARPGLCTVVPLSLTPPERETPFAKLLKVPFELPKRWGDQERWIKGDMINAVGFHRIDLLRLGKSKEGKRLYQTSALPPEAFNLVKRCVLHGLGLSSLTKHLRTAI
ncbi:MAG: type II toxin-antitoxin system PemK/MazF family toxin [Salinarimonadaceae bacterium]|nr:MAG: type II toxin-antitoxin system PemK/MazF family toxin [Salinarimonadaceae bacterium]